MLLLVTTVPLVLVATLATGWVELRTLKNLGALGGLALAMGGCNDVVFFDFFGVEGLVRSALTFALSPLASPVVVIFTELPVCIAPADRLVAGRLTLGFQVLGGVLSVL